MKQALLVVVLLVLGLLAFSAPVPGGPPQGAAAKPAPPPDVDAALAALAHGDMSPTAWTFVRDWGFELTWNIAATPDDVGTLQKSLDRRLRFRKGELAGTFGAPGRYNLMVFVRKTGESQGTLGTIDELGRSASDWKYSNERFAVIRAVFLDGKLAASRFWANVELSKMRGGVNRTFVNGLGRVRGE